MKVVIGVGFALVPALLVGLVFSVFWSGAFGLMVGIAMFGLGLDVIFNSNSEGGK